MKKRSRKSFTVSPIFAVRVIRDHVGRAKIQLIQWAHSGKDSSLKKLVRLLDAPPAPYLDEKEYQWCENDAETPTPKAAVNTKITGVVNSDVLRLRANIANTGAKDAKVYLGLRYSDDGGVTWYSLGGAPDAPATPHFEYRLSDFGIDGTTVTTLMLPASDTAGVHIESVPTAELTILVGTCVEYDFCIHCTANASSYTTYLFKIVKTDETGAYLADLDAYTTQPELSTGEVAPVTEKYASDSGTGTDAPAVSANIPATDAGIGAETIVSIGMQVDDAGSGAETITAEASVSVADAGAGTDVAIVSYAEQIVADTGAGADVVAIEGSVLVEDLGSGVEVVSAEGAIPATDDGVGSDVATLSYAEKKAEDEGVGVDEATVISPSACPRDGVEGVLIREDKDSRLYRCLTCHLYFQVEKA